ncbi:MAG: tripartite tricarboxylate transporter substrate binding protein [Betaproteobacteria bacterium]|nr:tripartite tricarboxylate transporter substrate binding protein [Betaproteobacteria bacterium]
MLTTRLALFIAGIAFAGVASASSWPERPVKLLVGYAAGGSTDVIARLLAPRLAEGLGKPVVVENKPGASGDLAGELLLQAPADGYTLLLSTVAMHAINPGLAKVRRFDPVDDFAPIAMVASYPMILIGSPQSTFRMATDLQALARKSDVFFASSGIGSPGHLAGELLARALGVPLTHVPYKGGAPSVVAVMSGETHLSFATLPAVVPQIRAGKVRAVGLASRVRNPAVAGTPTMAELGVPDFDIGTWTGVVGPRGTPADVITKVNGAVAAALVEPSFRSRLEGEGAEIQSMRPEEFGRLIRSENARWVAVVRAAGIQAQ